MASWKSSLNFGADAEVTGGGVLTDVPRHPQPPVILTYQLQSLPSPRVSSNLTVMVQSHDFLSDVGSGRDVDFSAEV